MHCESLNSLAQDFTCEAQARVSKSRLQLHPKYFIYQCLMSLFVFVIPVFLQHQNKYLKSEQALKYKHGKYVPLQPVRLKLFTRHLTRQNRTWQRSFSMIKFATRHTQIPSFSVSVLHSHLIHCAKDWKDFQCPQHCSLEKCGRG